MPPLRPVPPAKTVRRPKPANYVHELCTNWLQNTRKNVPKNAKKRPKTAHFSPVFQLLAGS